MQGELQKLNNVHAVSVVRYDHSKGLGLTMVPDITGYDNLVGVGGYDMSNVDTGELLVEWLQLVLPTLLDLAHANGRPVIPWYRDAHCKLAILKRIMQEALAASFGTEHFLDTKCDSAECARCDGTVPRPAVHSAGALPALRIAGEASRRRVRLPAHALLEEGGASHHLFLSPHHPASAALQRVEIWQR